MTRCLPMRVREFEDLVIRVLREADHPEIVSADSTARDADDHRHTRVRVSFASGAATYIMVREVTGPSVPKHSPFELPKEAM